MPTVIGHHDVKDKDHWLASPKREEVFGPLGVTNIRTFVNPQNPTQVAVLMDVPDMDAVMALMQSEAGAEAEAYDGVLAETLPAVRRPTAQNATGRSAPRQGFSWPHLARSAGCPQGSSPSGHVVAVQTTLDISCRRLRKMTSAL